MEGLQFFFDCQDLGGEDIVTSFSMKRILQSDSRRAGNRMEKKERKTGDVAGNKKGGLLGNASRNEKPHLNTRKEAFIFLQSITAVHKFTHV